MGTIVDLYESFIQEKTSFDDKEYFYNFIPKTYLDAIDQIQFLSKPIIAEDKISKVKTILERYHKKLGLLSPKTKENIEQLDNGVVLSGQQATIFGGSGIVGNKIVSSVILSEISEEKGRKLVPTFLVNTHDGIQPEITTIHLPNNQSSISKALILPETNEGATAETISLNDFDWLNTNLEIIRNIFSEFKSSVDKPSQKLFQEKYEHIITFLRETYRKAQTIGDWIALIWGIQTNILNDWGVVYVPSSDGELRELMVNGFIPFLKNRRDYISEFNLSTKKIEQLDLTPTTAPKDDNYSPFFYECPNDHYRINLICEENDDELNFSGECPIDERKYSFTISKNNPDLTKMANLLSPRLDTNQAQLQSILPVYLRVSGPGEINYNAQVIPAIRKIGIQFPIFIKYTRMFYNTPWIEKISEDPLVKEHSLFDQDFFKILGSLGKAKRKNEIDILKSTSFQLAEKILKKQSSLMAVNSKPTNSVEKYKSWQFGMYDEYHQWQEVSWPWFIMASVSGLNDYLASYKRSYSPNMPVGGINYINTRL